MLRELAAHDGIVLKGRGSFSKERSMKKDLFIFAIAALLIWPACSKKPESAARVEVIDGIEYVHNTETPLHPNKTVTLEEELSIGGEDEEGNIVLFRPSRFIVDQNENIYISDRQDQVIKVFDPNGRYVRTIGAKGEGPGEFRSVGYQIFLPDGRLLVMDFSSRRTSIFESSGKYLESHQWINRLSQLHFATESSYIVTEYTFEGGNPFEGRRLFIKEYDFEGKEIRSFGEFVPEETKMHVETNRVLALPLPYSPQSIFAADHTQQYLYHCLNNKYTIEVFDKTGKVFRKIVRSYEPVLFTRKDAEEFRGRYERSRNEGIRKLAKEIPMPTTKTITLRMLADDLGNLWVETHEQKEEMERTFTAYDIFKKDGYYEAKIWLDRRPRLFMKGKMYLMETNEETGYIFLKRYRIIWSD